MSPGVRQKGRLNLADLLDGLRANGMISAKQAEDCQRRRLYFRADTHPLILLAEEAWRNMQPPRQLLDLAALTKWLAEWSDMEYLYIDPLKINFAAVTDVMSSAYATRYRILPVEVRSNEVVVATCEPFDFSWQAQIKEIQRKKIHLVISNPEEIARYQVEFYSLAKSVRGALKRGQSTSGLADFEQLVELGKTRVSLDANDQHIVSVVDWLWQYAFEQDASDIHLEPRRDLGVVRFRINGILHQVYQIPMPVLNAMTSRIKILGRMDVVEKRRPQDGRIKTRTPDGQEIELRLSTLPTAFGEKLVMRIFDPKVLLRNFSDLGLDEENLKRWRNMTGQRHGIILVTGPTGSGKTTTLYTTLKQLATPEVNVCTLEDPIEMIEATFNQVQIQPGLDVSFANGIRAMLRQDPDIIMVGEIRDLEAADMAIQAAMTGHLVLATLHTNDAASAIPRLLDLGVAPYQLQSTLLGVMAQRLLRILCPKCKTTQPIRQESKAVWDDMLSPWKIKLPEYLCYPVGCLDCRMTGYQGRLGLYELIDASPSLKSAINTDCNASSLRLIANKEGWVPMRISGAMKVFAGLSTIDELLRVCPPPEI